MSRTQCTLKVAHHMRVWEFLYLFLHLLALGHIGNSAAAVMYADPSATSGLVGAQFPGLTFSAVPATGSYSGTTVLTQMTQSGPAIGAVYAGATASPTINYFSPIEPRVGFTLAIDYLTSAMRVDFATPLTYVSVDFIPDDTDTGVLQAYSADGTLLGEAVGRDSRPSTFALSLTSSNTPISYILATYGDTGFVGRVGYEVSAVPEPETYAMLLAGLGLVGAAARRRHG